MLGALVTVGVGALLIKAPLCPSATLFGIPCPGCGLTRATLALLSGDVRSAIGFHPLVFLLAPLYFGLLGAAAVSYLRGNGAGRHAPRRPWLQARLVTIGGWCLLVLVVGVWLARFLGAFGGPAPVQTLAQWAQSRAP